MLHFLIANGQSGPFVKGFVSAKANKWLNKQTHHNHSQLGPSQVCRNATRGSAVILNIIMGSAETLLLHWKVTVSQGLHDINVVSFKSAWLLPLTALPLLSNPTFTANMCFQARECHHGRISDVKWSAFDTQDHYFTSRKPSSELAFRKQLEASRSLGFTTIFFPPLKLHVKNTSSHRTFGVLNCGLPK